MELGKGTGNGERDEAQKLHACTRSPQGQQGHLDDCINCDILYCASATSRRREGNA